MWQWEVLGGHLDYPWWGRTYSRGLEPFTSATNRGLQGAVEDGAAVWLPPGGQLESAVRVTPSLSHIGVSHVDKLGAVTLRDDRRTDVEQLTAGLVADAKTEVGEGPILFGTDDCPYGAAPEPGEFQHGGLGFVRAATSAVSALMTTVAALASDIARNAELRHGDSPVRIVRPATREGAHLVVVGQD